MLVACRNDLGIYGEAALTVINMARPHVHVEAAVIEPEALEEEVKRLDPHLVIRSPPIPANVVSDTLAWIELSPHPDNPSRIRVEDRYWEMINPTLEELLAIVDEVESASDKVPPGNNGPKAWHSDFSEETNIRRPGALLRYNLKLSATAKTRS